MGCVVIYRYNFWRITAVPPTLGRLDTERMQEEVSFVLNATLSTVKNRFGEPKTNKIHTQEACGISSLIYKLYLHIYEWSIDRVFCLHPNMYTIQNTHWQPPTASTTAQGTIRTYSAILGTLVLGVQARSLFSSINRKIFKLYYMYAIPPYSTVYTSGTREH